MTASPATDIALDARSLASLLDEIRRYLDAVETFRREGHEPCWKQEALEVRP